MTSQKETIELRDAVEAEHGGKATFLQTIAVSEEVAGTKWKGIVYVFHLIGHATAKRAYVWTEGGVAGRHIVLGIPPITSPHEAVKDVLSKIKK